MAADLTILYITASAVPKHWQEYQIKHLLEASAGAPIISVSRFPLSLGTNLIDSEPKSYWNEYMQLLRAAKLATTPFVAMAEDDTLYTKQHFYEFRPPMDAVSYDRSRWSLFTWDPLYCLRQRISNCSLVASREYLIDALEERQRTWSSPPDDKLLGEVGRSNVDSRLKVSRRNMVEFYSRGPIVQLNHPAGTDKGDYGRQGGVRMIKRHGQIQAYDIPYWGKAIDIAKEYR